MNGLGIKKRLLLLALLPGVVIALSLFVYFTRGQLDLVNQSLHERGLTIARQLAPASEYGFITGNPELLGQLAKSLLQQSDIIGVSITDTEQQVLFSEGALTGTHTLPQPAEEDAALCAAQDAHLIFCAPIIKTRLQVSDFPSDDVVGKHVIGVVYVELSTSTLQKQRSSIIVRAIIITTVLLLITGFIAVRIGGEISQPILNVTARVGKIAQGELDLQTYSGAGGEIGLLEKGIDAMTVSLRAARDEMQSHIDNATIKLRTALEDVESKNKDLEEQRLKAQAANEAKSRFLANMSHEIRTPLSGMVGLLFLLRHTQPTEEQQEYLENLESSATTLRTLIDDILDLSRIEAGRLVIHEQEFMIRKLINSIMTMLAPSAHQRGIELISHIERDVPQWVMGDPMRLRQVLTNLVGNAIKFTEKGHVRLHLSCVPGGGVHSLQIRFSVEDSGIGIAAEKLDYIFESFAQADESTTRRYGGSGLGTTISRELVGLMGGDLRVTSVEEQGTSFTFELPMGTSEGGEAAQWPSEGNRVLLLDEYPLSAVAERDSLETCGYRVDLVTTEKQFLDSLTENRGQYAIAIFAENSREGKWLRLARQLQQDSIREEMLFIHLTFFDGDNELSLFDINLHKPLDGEMLRARIEELQNKPVRVDDDLEPVSMGNSEKLTILLAEDDPINAKVMSYFLHQKGHEVILARNGREALELMHSHVLDLAFLDMRMPETDGLMVARQWRSDEGTGERLPLIAVTANVTREDRAACFDAGMDDFVSKPVDPGRLDELLVRYVKRKRSAAVGNIL